jgi:DNA-binding response OmpR family regulator
MKAKILVVDDEPDALELIRFNLEKAGYKVGTAADGAEALRKVQSFSPDLVVLDWMLPELDGLEICKTIRNEPATAALPIIMLTAKTSEIDRILGLEIGANDYVTKPFSVRELMLRIKKQLQHKLNSEEAEGQLQFSNVVVDIDRHRVTTGGKPIQLTSIEFKLLTALVKRRGRVQSREQLLKDVWEYDTGIDSRTVDTHMRRLRQKLGPSGRMLDTVRGFGYRLLEAE